MHPVEEAADALPPPAVAGGDPLQRGRARGSGGLGFAAQAVFVVALLGGFAWWQLGGLGREADPHWRVVLRAEEATAAAGAERLVRVDARGAETLVDELRVSRRDLDPALGEAVAGALRAGDAERASELVAAAQDPSAELTLAAGFADSLGDDARFYTVRVRDVCDDDGDVVELAVNGRPMGTVAIHRAGATLRLPLERGSNTVTLRAVEDGRGGVTVGFQTEDGVYTARRLRVGKEVTLGVVVR